MFTPEWVQAAASLLGLLISGWAVWLVHKTLGTNREATDAAKAAVEETRRIGHQQLRAYLSVLEGHIDRNERTCRLPIRNYGQTPAHDVVVWTSWSSSNEKTEHRLGVVDPGSSPAAVFRFPEDEVTRILARADELRICVTIHFSDMNGKGWERTAEYYPWLGDHNQPPGDNWPLHVLPGTAKERERK